MKVVLKERRPPEEMFTVIHDKRNVATDRADYLKNRNQADLAQMQDRRNLHAAATFLSTWASAVFLDGVV